MSRDTPIARRVIFAVTAAMLLPRLGHAQPTKRHVIGMLDGESAASAVPSATRNAFLQALRDLGYGESDITIESRFAEFHADRLPDLADELVRLEPEAIVTAGTAAARAAKQATATIPIVMAASANPVGLGLVASLARPGGNVTGFSNDQEETVGKRLQLLKTVAPGARRIAVLFNPTSPAWASGWPMLEARPRRSIWNSSRRRCAFPRKCNPPSRRSPKSMPMQSWWQPIQSLSPMLTALQRSLLEAGCRPFTGRAPMWSRVV